MSGTQADVHIHAPHMMTRAQRYRDRTIKALMWVLYTYLWAPIISLVAWLLGFEFAYNVMILSGGINGLYRVLWMYCLGVLLIVVVVSGWSIFNNLRYASRNRRMAQDPASDEQLAEYFGIEQRQLTEARKLRVAVVSFDENGELENFEDQEKDYSRGSRGRNVRSQMTRANIKAV